MVDLESHYHALLGRPALAKFMASTHVAYLKMKMPGPNGPITVSGSFKRSIECAKAGSALAKSLVIAEEKRKMLKAVQLAQQHVQLGMPSLTNPLGNVAFKATNETKVIHIDPENPERNVQIGAGLDDK